MDRGGGVKGAGSTVVYRPVLYLVPRCRTGNSQEGCSSVGGPAAPGQTAMPKKE